MTETMKAIIANPNTPLVWGEANKPTPGAGELLIEVAAAGMNRADLIQRSGAYPPPPGASDILGLEVSGTVAETGSGTSRFKVGDKVMALLAGGGYAEYAAVDEGSVFPVVEGMDMVSAACLPEAMMTVWANVFDRVNLTRGEAFLCHGGTSGIGVMAIQMARQAGAEKIFTTTGSDEKCALASSLGADLAINYREDDFVKQVKEAGGADVILDMVGGDYVQKNINAAKLNGRIINIAYQNGFETTVNFGLVLMKRLTLAATTLRARAPEEKRRIRDAVERDFLPAVDSGSIRPVLDSQYPIADAEKAHAAMAKGGHSGKIVLVV